MSLTTLEQRAYTRLSTPSGRLLIVAADQRNSMKAVMPGSWPRHHQICTKKYTCTATNSATGTMNTHLIQDQRPAALCVFVSV